MSFDGMQFIALDDAASSDYEPLDALTEVGIAQNAEWLDDHGHAVVWSPRSRATYDQAAFLGHRPYVSCDWSTILCVPWLVQPGLEELTTLLDVRVSDTEEAGLGAQLHAELAGFSRAPQSNAPTASSGNTATLTYTWQPRELAISARVPEPTLRPTPVRNAVVTDLRVWHRGAVGAAVRATASLNYYTELGGRFVGVNDNHLINAQSGVRPNKDDANCYAVRDITGADHDILRALRTTGPNTEFFDVRPRSNESGFEPPVQIATPISIRPIAYTQVRAVQVRERFGLVDVPRSRYTPHRIIEAGDSTTVVRAVRAVADRARPLWIGPEGSSVSPESAPTGYGFKFERVTANAAYQSWLRIPLWPRRTQALRLLLNVVPVWRNSAWRASNLAPEQLAERAGLLTWDFELVARQYQDGSATPAPLASQVLTDVQLTHYPTCNTAHSALLRSELLFESWLASETVPWKEGQLYREDLTLVQRLDLTLDGLPTPDLPWTLELRARADAASGVWPDGPSAAQNPPLSDLQLLCVGATLWEV